MNEIKNYFKSKKKAILSLMLAFVLMLSFNYSPILLLRDLVKTDAYKSNTTQTYYANSDTTTESNVGSGEYPSSLADYFKNSSNNFNIQTYYSTRFSDLLAGHVDSFLKNVADVKVGPAGATDAEKTLYSELYSEFLTKTGTYDGKKYDTLLEYYTAKSSTIKDTYGCSTFREFAEYFVSHDIEYQTNNTDNPTKTLYAFPNCVYTENSVEYKIQFYNVLANNMTDNHLTIDEQVEVKDENDEVIGTFRDGIADTEKFYEQSVSYNRVKDYIDAEIEKSIAIYTYDNETQNKNVAAILANGAPSSKSYYYKDNTYETKLEETKKYVETEGVKNVYILMAKNSTIEGQVTAKDITTMQYNGNDIGEGVSDNDSLLNNFQKYPLLYRQVQFGEYGYLDNYITYYKYESIPYQTLSDGNYALYTTKSNPTADELATYDFLYVDLISSSSIDSSYVNVPLPNLSSITTYENIYFSTLFGINQTSTEGNTRFDNLASLFTNGGASNLYLKYKTTEKKVIYIQTGKKSEFEVNNQNYSYLSDIVEADFKNMSDAELEEYYEIDGTKFSNYYVNGYTLYFKKVKEDYKTLTSATYTSAYETKNVPNIPYEKDYYVTKSYEMDSLDPTARKIYVYLPDAETQNTTSYTSITQDTLDSARNNEYVKVPSSIITKNNMDSNFTYYYKHNISTDKKEVIYILVSDENYDKEKDNEVYKTLNYQVLKKSDYSYTQYVSVQKTDANYNENFSLYYKYSTSDTIYIQNKITNKNAIYVIDDSVTSSDKTTYKDNGRNFIPITTSEYEDNYNFYIQITEDDVDNYNLKYTLYYKYNSTDETERIIYMYSTSTSTEYETFSESTTDYLASDYELILPNDPNYVAGTNLYYKKIRNTGSEVYTTNETKTTYKYTTSSAVTLSANSYYVVSFYVYTNGTYNVSGIDITESMQASLYVEDSKEIIKNAYIENISTEGKWQKRYLFIATDSLSSSSIKISMYMGDKESIMGSEYIHYSSANGVVMFDDIKIIKINQTDYNNLSIDGKEVQTPPKSTEGEGSSSDPSAEPSTTPDPETATATASSVTFDYVDDYGNEIIATSISCKVNASVNIYDSSKNFDDMYNFDSMSEDTFENLFVDADNIDGFTIPSELWQMYISRDNSGQGNNYILKQYQKAYKEGKLSASIVEEKSFYNDKLDDDDNDEDNVIDTDSPDTQVDVAAVESTFNKNNKVLKLQNTSRQLNLGLISNYFVVEQSQYYKLTIWIYSPDEDASATLILSSILKTASTQVNGSLLSSTANVKANMAEYTSSQNNEYGWIPISFYIEGNALHSQNCYLTLMANKNNTVYFDNITIEKITSSAYDTANSDSDTTTYCLSLAPSTSMISTGVTNGYFSNVTVTDNYNNIDYTIPRTAENWTVSTKSNEVVAGVVAGSDEYLSHTEPLPGYGNFYERYNSGIIPENKLKYNLYAIYMPKQISNPLNEYGGKDTQKYDQAGIYKFYSSSISLSASTTYKLSFEFFKGFEFKGDVIANIYSSSVKDANLIESLSVNSNNLGVDWNELSFYISTDTSSVTLYIELGVQNASGTCFFRNVSNVSQSKTIDEIRDEMILDSENIATPSGSDVIDLYNKNSFKFTRFVELNAFEFSVHGSEKDALSNTYENKEFANSLTATSDYTVGSSSVAVASYYTTYETVKYTVTIDKVEYYLKEVTDETTGAKSYKLYSDSNYTDEITVLNGKKVTVDGTNKVTVGTESPTDYTITETKTTNYIYNFENDLVINNVFISADELKNEISENVIVLANSYSTDYTYISPNYTTKLEASSYYVLKFYVKTSSFEDGFGLNIDLDSSISRKWTNIDTTDSKYDDLRDETYGFVCYQILISTGSNAISTFSASFSLGSKESTGAGYAIIAGIELEKFSTEKLFNEYSLNYDNVDKDSNDTIIKSYFGTTSSSSSTDDSSSTTDEDADDLKSSIWATFFYIFSSLLLGIALVLALVATIIKKHPIKVVQQEQNDHDRDNTFITTQSKKVSNEKEVATQVETEEVVKKDDGFV